MDNCLSLLLFGNIQERNSYVMAKRSRPTEKKTAARTGSTALFLIVAAVLIVLLVVMYIHNRNRKAEFAKLQADAAISEEYQVLEPRLMDEEGQEGADETVADGSDQFVNEAAPQD